MNLLRTLVAAALAVGLTASPALADPPRDADRAFRATKEGRSMPLPQIKRRVMPMVGDDVVDLGPELRGDTYRLKFIRKDGRVVWVDVDAATGRVLRRSF
jgi:uncharacterized membrane protein YkoI